MLTKGYVASLFCAGWLGIGSGLVSAQQYPNKAIRVVTGGVGGGPDVVARLITQGLTTAMGWVVVVDNRGGSVLIPGEIVSHAVPDGYTLLVAGTTFWIGSLMQVTPYNVVKDFVPITIALRAPNLLVVNPALPVKSVRELIALAKSRPGEINYAAGSTGGGDHLSAELFKALAGVDMVRVLYKSGGAAVNALVAGEVQLSFNSATSTSPFVKSGQLRALAVTTAEPSALFPALPTIAASGVPDYESGTMNVVFAPARTPGTIINRLDQEIVRVLNQQFMKEKFTNIGVEVVGSTPEQSLAKIKSDMIRWGKVIKDANIRIE